MENRVVEVLHASIRLAFPERMEVQRSLGLPFHHLEVVEVAVVPTSDLPLLPLLVPGPLEAM